MEVSVGGLGHVVVDDNVDTLNIHTTAKQIRGNQNALLEVLEVVVALQAAGDVIGGRVRG